MTIDLDVLGLRPAVLHHKDKRAVLAGLHRTLRQNHRVLFNPQDDARGDKLAGPQLLLLVFHPRLEHDRPGRRIDGVIDEHERALRDRLCAAVRCDLHFQLRRVPVPAHVVEVALRYAERHQDRLSAVDHHQRRATRPRRHQIAGLDAQAAGAPGNRRADLRVGQLQLGLIENGAVRVHRGLQRLDLGGGNVVFLARDVVLLQQRPQPRFLRLCLHQLRLVASNRGAHLLDRRLHGTRIDAEQNLPLLHTVPLLEHHRLQHAADLRAHRDTMLGFDRADGVDDDRHRLARGFNGANSDGTTTASARTFAFGLGRFRRRIGAAAFGARLCRPPVVSATAQRDDHQHYFPERLH